MGGCKGICKDHKDADLAGVKLSAGRYKQGIRYCTKCEAYFKNRTRCICCNNLLRSKSKYSNKMKQKYYENKNKNIKFDKYIFEAAKKWNRDMNEYVARQLSYTEGIS